MMESLNLQLLNIIKSPHLSDKLSPLVGELDKAVLFDLDQFVVPSRDKKIQFSDVQIKFPRSKALKDKNNLALALHAFANHELLAIEMMATAILKFKTENEQDHRYKLGLIKAINDEQKHFKLYCHRINELGYEFGDFPLNDFFWSKMKFIKQLNQFAAVMNLTFESANLDFALFYENVFKEIEDIKSANIMNIVLTDEISHVALGNHFLKNYTSTGLWQYYCSVLPMPITPARAKGMIYNKEARIKAQLDQEFISNLENYKDEFKITNRKEWDK